jgi:glycosyltransferase involved in cell wall biosynthesis
MSDTIIVIPCYNEANRLPRDVFAQYEHRHAALRFLFVDDGSRDGTAEMLERLARRSPHRFEVVRLTENCGKAEAVRRGLRLALDYGPRYVGFWDADLATPLHSIGAFEHVLDDCPAVEMVFGARVQLLGRRIRRHAWRHYLGRGFATAVSHVLQLPVYDTQCGAKLFRANSRLRDLLAEPFLSRWIFDVEIVSRLIQAHDNDHAAAERAIFELPLMHWEDVAGSRLHWTDFFKAARDLILIHRRYHRGARRSRSLIRIPVCTDAHEPVENGPVIDGQAGGFDDTVKAPGLANVDTGLGYDTAGETATDVQTTDPQVR